MSSTKIDTNPKQASSLNLEQYGILGVREIIRNPSFDTLYAEETAEGLEGYEKGILTESGAISVDTGIFTGRSPKDKYLVRDDITRDTVRIWLSHSYPRNVCL
jgi:phosphoenolpyruvate carboxykinase (ATP)